MEKNFIYQDDYINEGMTYAKNDSDEIIFTVLSKLDSDFKHPQSLFINYDDFLKFMEGIP